MSGKRFPSASSLLLALLILALGVPPLQADISPGLFVMKASPREPVRFGAYVAPGFYDTRNGIPSDEVMVADLFLEGVPIPPLGGSPSLEPGDTLLQLLDTVDFSGGLPESKAAAVRVVMIHLASSQPLTVTYGGANPELWDVEICASNSAQQNSRILLVDECGTAGTFTTVLAFAPKFIFTRRSDHLQRIYDPGTDPNSGNKFLSFSGHGHWMNRDSSTTGFVEVAPGTVIDATCDNTPTTFTVGTSNAILGLARVGCNPAVPNQGFQEIQPIFVGAQSGTHYAIEPATRDDRAFPDFESWLPGRSFDPRAALGLGAFGALGLAAVVIRPRRPKK